MVSPELLLISPELLLIFPELLWDGLPLVLATVVDRLAVVVRPPVFLVSPQQTPESLVG
jgi:hypothetical protein